MPACFKYVDHGCYVLSFLALSREKAHPTEIAFLDVQNLEDVEPRKAISTTSKGVKPDFRGIYFSSDL